MDFSYKVSLCDHCNKCSLCGFHHDGLTTAENITRKCCGHKRSRSTPLRCRRPYSQKTGSLKRSGYYEDSNRNAVGEIMMYPLQYPGVILMSLKKKSGIKDY